MRATLVSSELLELLPDATLIVGDDGRVLVANSSAESLFGYAGGEMAGRLVEALMPVAHRDRHVEHRRRFQANPRRRAMGIGLELRALRKDGYEFPVEISLGHLNTDNGVVAICCVRDISERISLIRERERLARELELLLEATEAGIIATDLDGVVTMANPAGCQILGYSHEEILGRSVDSICSSCRDPMERVLRTARSVQGQDMRLKRKDGAEIIVAFLLSPVRDDGTIRGMVASFHDITENCRLRMRLERVERIESLGAMAATLTHEFNNVLMAIQPLAEVIERRAAGEPLAGVARGICRAVSRGRRVTQEILSFTRSGEPALQPIRAKQWLEQEVMAIRAVLGEHITFTLAGEDLPIRGDRHQLGQVIANLASNAASAMPDGGDVVLTVAHPAAGQSFNFGSVPNPECFAHLTFRDDGVGMSRETAAHALDAFYTTKRDGTGVGLAFVDKTISLHGGRVFVESNPGEGTAVHLFIPLAAADAVTPGNGTRPIQGHQPSLRLLVVEDDALVRDAIREILMLEGIEAEFAANGSTALRLLDAGRPDVMILDIGLPDMDCTEVYEQARRRWEDLPVVFSSGHAERELPARIREDHRCRFLPKPYSLEHLRATLREVTSSPSFM